MAKSDDSTEEWVSWDDPKLRELLWKQVRETAANCRIRLERCPNDDETRDLMLVLLALSSSRGADNKWQPVSKGTLGGSAKAYLKARGELPHGIDGPDASDDLASLFELLVSDEDALMQGFEHWPEGEEGRIPLIAEAFVRRLLRNPERARLVTSNLGTMMHPDTCAVEAVGNELRRRLSGEAKNRRDPEQLVIGCLRALGATNDSVKNLYGFRRN